MPAVCEEEEDESGNAVLFEQLLPLETPIMEEEEDAEGRSPSISIEPRGRNSAVVAALMTPSLL